ncbi:hypothetical protein A3H38_05530 [candidate division WOR-1 bacterium RIFCSPLOWO2_02_FULL_46_20]|uniref:histidine kinase n=2 Tax=Saganbacteria TaxID=1703751 RepID=A0A1F4REL6_UNCSA|nr:MAG: hypothetical protein A3J44_01060 [candidate division WOR-1 bacterium RIFCSPHIGHO2_02_FULL_45_12]OGC06630.1 MAG: hypothetical protein A3H38_05530 [candidate division WOR-1 bacterium RIFCSPLOWO2_02_FULL_46_20]OGC08770.1 MAG: hypothetical protein A3F86_05330 [candidate division WOR-1 bacterium RIFCSPLOWO2_12_FULL_45_9]
MFDPLLITSLASLLLAAFVFLKGGKSAPSLTLGFLSLSIAGWCFGQFMGGIVSDKAQVLFWTRLGLIGAVFLPVLFVHFTAAFLKKEHKLWLFYLIGCVFLLADFTPLLVADVAPIVGIGYYPQPGLIYQYFTFYVFICFIYGFFLLFRAYRFAKGEQRNQLLYLILGALIGFSGGATTFFPVWGIDFPILSRYALPLYVLITIYAILKHKLLNISVIVREGLIYSVLTLFFTGFYVSAVLITNYFLSRFVSLNPALTIALVVFASVLIFQPLRDKVQRLIDQVFFRGEYQYKKTINDLSVENQNLFRSLLQADKLASLGTLSAGMAHEIKNPLASIKGLTQVLEENLNDPAFIKKYQEIVCRQIDRMNNLIEKLLHFGQPKGLSLSEFNINRVIEEVLNLIEDQCRKRAIVVEKRLAKDFIIKGDAEQLSQVFMNLLLNAVQAMPEGGGLVVESRVANHESIVIEVTDNGQGIAADKLDNIFDPFYSTKDEGVGMGLAVAYRIVKEHGGEVKVESQVGKGTTFKIWLPIKQKPSA